MDKQKKENNSKEEENMALLARPIDGMMKIDKEKTAEFFEDARKNTIKPDFLKRCQKFAEMLQANKQ